MCGDVKIKGKVGLYLYRILIGHSIVGSVLHNSPGRGSAQQR